MVSTRSLIEELGNRGFAHLAMWTRGVDTDLFSPERAAAIDLPRPIFVSVGRLAVEKNLAAFLALDLPGSKVVIGDGPQAGELRRRFPDTHFLGQLEGETLAAHLAAADVFVFPSRTDTFGVVQLEALACGVPVAAYPVPGPQDVIGGNPVGVLGEDLKSTCLKALTISREACRAFAFTQSWERSALQFISHCRPCRRMATARDNKDPATPGSPPDDDDFELRYHAGGCAVLLPGDIASFAAQSFRELKPRTP
jgi:glycosyltransferase involved in cell wall biosynthesis